MPTEALSSFKWEMYENNPQLPAYTMIIAFILSYNSKLFMFLSETPFDKDRALYAVILQYLFLDCILYNDCVSGSLYIITVMMRPINIELNIVFVFFIIYAADVRSVQA